jgi:hypothetical protein
MVAVMVNAVEEGAGSRVRTAAVSGELFGGERISSDSVFFMRMLHFVDDLHEI